MAVNRFLEKLRTGPISGFRLRTKLLLLALTTLALPWAGCQYAREMETVLRESEQQSLLAVTTTIAGSLKGRQELLFRADSLPGADGASPRDITPVVLSGVPLLDGRADEWDSHARNLVRVAGPGGDSLRLLAATHERWLYLAMLVRDDRWIFDASDLTPLDSSTIGDRVWLAFDDKRGGQQQLFFASTAPGAVHARRIETQEYGRERAVEEPRIQAAWQRSRDGWVLEMGVPLSMVGQHLGVLIDDRDRRGAARASYGTLEPSDLRASGRLIAASPDLNDHLRQFSQPGVELTVSSASGATLTRLDAPALPGDYTRLRGFLPRMYRLMLDGGRVPRSVSQADRARAAQDLTEHAVRGSPATTLFAGRYENSVIVAAAAPIFAADGKHVIGVIQLAQTADRWLTLRDRALTRLLNLTLFVTLFAVGAAFWFAGRMTLRISRLGAASETALTREGNLARELPEADAADELGDLSRSFSSLLGRLDEYTGYLRSLAGKLAHEIRTPLTIIRSSLENLESEVRASEEAKVYIARAREGSERLGAILTAMGAATRVEEAIAHSERQRFDLAGLVRATVEAYRSAFPARRFSCTVPESPVEMTGAPDLIVQMLDKLVDNAVDFSVEGATITIVLRAEETFAELSVANPGPPLP
ncbi:MAG TPA: histidine kinase dimerization/phospho-acceptor domain-containing protein, partial [Steroidobacteraceae bacterium]|nr:histidine kinase dimerization/phospho-acceptor domain-containing protein [Steroidobacteraceae bacterium]